LERRPKNLAGYITSSYSYTKKNVNSNKKRKPIIMPSHEALWSKARDIITIVVLPFAFWVFSSVSTLQHEVIKLEAAKQQISELKGRVNTISKRDAEQEIRAARLETKLENISGDLVEIKTILNKLLEK